MKEDPWKILKIKPTNDQKKIDYAWRKLASQHHPDHGGDPENFKIIRTAYERAISLSDKVIEVKHATRLFRIYLEVGCSDVINEKTWNLRWIDEVRAIVNLEVKIPVWNVSWGRSHIMVLKDIKSSQGRPSEIQLEVAIKDDDLIFTGNELVWSPILPLEEVLETRTLTSIIANRHITVDLDNNGNGVLKSLGYYTNRGERLDILVKPTYIWPPKNEYAKI